MATPCRPPGRAALSSCGKARHGFVGYLSNPTGLAFGPDGNLYVSNYGGGGNLVQRFDKEGNLLPAPGPGGATFAYTGNSAPTGLAFGPDGNLYVATQSSNGSSVLRFDQAGDPRPAPGQGGAVFVPAGSGGLAQAVGLAFGPGGNLYVSSCGGGNVGQCGSGSILRFDGVTGQPLPAPGQGGATFVPQGSGGLSGPSYLFFNMPPRGTLQIGPAGVGLLGSTQSFQVTALDPANHPLANLPVTLAIIGANAQQPRPPPTARAWPPSAMPASTPAPIPCRRRPPSRASSSTRPPAPCPGRRWW